MNAHLWERDRVCLVLQAAKDRSLEREDYLTATALSLAMSEIQRVWEEGAKAQGAILAIVSEELDLNGDEGAAIIRLKRAAMDLKNAGDRDHACFLRVDL